jgi:hypothetical protein
MAPTSTFQHDWADLSLFVVLLPLPPSFPQSFCRYPIIMDAMASEVQRKGDAFMAKWAEIMTCMQPKTYFFRSAQGQGLGS